MKKSIFSLLFLIGCATMSSAQEITFTEVSHDFGEFDERDGSVSHDFHFTNTGDQPLLIKQVITGCGCTSAKWSDKPYAPGEKGVVRTTYLNIFRGHYMDFSVCGRSVSRKKTINLGDYSTLFSKMKAIDPDHAQEYEDAAQRFATENPTIGRTDRNRMFWTSDYMLHNRKRYDISVRAVSERTCRSESGNGENLWGTYLSEGAYNIRVKGDEYADIFAVWEWDKIPGTTTPEGEVENHNDWGVYGVSKFVAGASDGLYGAMGYAMDDYGMKAQKGGSCSTTR